MQGWKQVWRLGEVKLVVFLLGVPFLTYTMSGMLGAVGVKSPVQMAFLTVTGVISLGLVVLAHRQQQTYHPVVVPRGSLVGMEYLLYRASRSSFWKVLVQYRYSFLILWVWGACYYPVFVFCSKVIHAIAFVQETGLGKLVQSYAKSLLFQKKAELVFEPKPVPLIFPHILFGIVVVTLAYSVYVRLKFAAIDRARQ